MTLRQMHPPGEVAAGTETNHRVANNLALLAAMVELDSRAISDPEAIAVLTATRRRLHAVANVHRQLYREPEGQTVNLRAMLVDLGETLQHLVADDCARRTIAVQADDFDLPNEHAAAVAILVAELVGNACKHAYRVDVAGEVRVRFRVGPLGDWSLAVEDDGVGIAHHGGGARGLGSHIVRSVAHQLHGTHRWEAGYPGTRFVMSGNGRPDRKSVV